MFEEEREEAKGKGGLSTLGAITLAACGLGCAVALSVFLWGSQPRAYAGTPASRRLNKPVVQMQGLEPVASSDGIVE